MNHSSRLTDTLLSIAEPCDLFLKQVKATSLSSSESKLLQSCFGGYYAWTRLNSDSPPTPKRYSGSFDDFPPGRYYTLASNLSGDDEGTLQHELYAYGSHGCNQLGYFQFYDITVPSIAARALSALPSNVYQTIRDRLETPSILVSLCSVGGEPHPIVKAMGGSDSGYALLPLTIRRMHIERVVDLRVPTVAIEFSRIVSRELLSLRRGPIDSFAQMLPTMLTQDLGGGHGFSLAVGAALRKAGVDGLIYPSARFDSFCRIMEGRLVEHGGWHFVDYRGAGPVNTTFVDMDPWRSVVGRWGDAKDLPNSTNRVFPDVSIKCDSEGVAKGSWQVSGLAAWQLAFFEATFVDSFVRSIAQDYSEQMARVTMLIARSSANSGLLTGYAVAVQLAASGNEDAKEALFTIGDLLLREGATWARDVIRRFLKRCH